MKKFNFNKNWSYKKLETAEQFRPISLPYDCMLHEDRSDDAEGGCNNAWFEGYDYEFVKEFTLPEGDWKNIFLEFEGVYHRAEIYCNGQKVGYRPNGYIGIFCDITAVLREGKNTVRVIARGADIPNSRWYTGGGIYRDVNLYLAGENFIPPDGLKIRTVGIAPAVVELSVTAVGRGVASAALYYRGACVARGEFPVEQGHGSIQLHVPEAKLWSEDSPELYTCKVKFDSDETEETFGIRTIVCNAGEGLLINGKRTVLRGACLHHDNGLLGSVSVAEAEERKVQLLRFAGFNAIRSAHNPCSKTLLRACDKYGVMVMDEYADSWYVHKTKYDYATYLQEWYEADIADMVAKDYNHPCVVLYSLGNEVSETAETRGVDLFKKMRTALRKCDDTRPVTCGINIGFNQAAATGHSFFSDEKAFKNDFRNLGTEESNHRKWIFGPLFTKLNAILPGCDRATRDIFAASDVAGYNYGILRYKHDRRKYPERTILGSETFCEDAGRFNRIVKKEKGVIGDFVWTGFDHIGEVGLGAWEYKDYAPTYVHTKGWLTSGCGRIDITGKLLPEAYYMKAAYGLLKNPVIAVRPVNHRGERHSPSGWKFTNAVSSWAWDGCEGKKATVEVYACGKYVELYLNCKKVGRKRLGKKRRALFNLPYTKGILKAIVYDQNGRETGRSSLKSVEEETLLCVEAEKNSVEAEKLCYIRLRLADRNGTTKILKREKINVSVEGGELLGLGHACPFNADGYVNSYTETYYGEAMAIVRAGRDERVTVTASCVYGRAKAEIAVFPRETYAETEL